MELLVIKPAGPGLEDQTLTPTGVSQTLSRVSQTQTPVLTSLNPQLSGLDDGYGSSNSSPHSSVYSSQEIANDAVNVEVDWRTICLESTESYRGVTGIKVQKAHPSSTVSGQYRSSVAGPFVVVVCSCTTSRCTHLVGNEWQSPLTVNRLGLFLTNSQHLYLITPANVTMLNVPAQPAAAHTSLVTSGKPR
ncbi:hypothetical protein J6590_043823 [Homalodisca vitripennis]|nr:hypothetical protein J6590_043823 [Homalodisca vitripennis]